MVIANCPKLALLVRFFPGLVIQLDVVAIVTPDVRNFQPLEEKEAFIVPTSG